MRTWRGSVRFVSLALAASLGTGPASAQLLIATPKGEPEAVASAELAYASGGGVPVTWVALRLRGAPVALVAALPDDAQSGPTLDAWLSALELTASPNVLVPETGSDCGNKSSYVHVEWPRSAGEAPSELSVQQPEDVTAALTEAGVALWGDLPKASRYLVWSWPPSQSDRTTKTLRIVGGREPLSFAQAPEFPVMVDAVTRGSVSFPGEVPSAELGVTFVAGKPSTDYLPRLRGFLQQDKTTVLEMRGRGALFDWSIYEDSVSLAPLVHTYAKRAKRELPSLDDQACIEQLRALRSPDAPSAAACGAADDANLALAAVASDQATLQRFAVTASVGVVPQSAVLGGDRQPPVLRARRLDDSGCPQIESPPIVMQPPLQPTEPEPSPSAPSGTTTVVVEQTVYVDDGTPYQDGGCGCGTTTPDPTYEPSDRGSCSSDTSSSSDSSSDSCSGDSSSSSSNDYNGDSCSGDSSSSSGDDTSNDSCSGDSSSSSGDDTSNDSCSGDSSSSSSSDSSSDSCSGDSSSSSSSDSSYSGDTCTASARPGAERAGQSQASLRTPTRARGSRRVKTSLWGVAALALVLPIRRRKRSGRRVG